jgi:hypothetical protein
MCHLSTKASMHQSQKQSPHPSQFQTPGIPPKSGANSFVRAFFNEP